MREIDFSYNMFIVKNSKCKPQHYVNIQVVKSPQLLPKEGCRIQLHLFDAILNYHWIKVADINHIIVTQAQFYNLAYVISSLF